MLDLVIRAFQIRDIYSISKVYLSLPEKDRQVFHPCPFHWWLVVPIVSILSVEPIFHKVIRLIFLRASFIPLIVRGVDGQCAGFAYLQMRGRNTDGRYLTTLGILVGNDYRLKGIGSQLMGSLIKHAEENSVGKIWLTVFADNEPAINLYQKHGFKITNTVEPNTSWNREAQAVHEMELVLDIGVYKR